MAAAPQKPWQSRLCRCSGSSHSSRRSSRRSSSLKNNSSRRSLHDQTACQDHVCTAIKSLLLGLAPLELRQRLLSSTGLVHHVVMDHACCWVLLNTASLI